MDSHHHQNAIEAAEKLLKISKSSSNERSDVQYPLLQLIEAVTERKLQVETEVYVGDGYADLYVPEMRFVAETKSPHSRAAQDSKKLSETRKQVERYIQPLRDAQLERRARELFKSRGFDDDRPWTEVITDGRVIHIRKWAHEPDSQPKEQKLIHVTPDFKPKNIVEIFKELLEGAPAALPWVPKNPVPLYKETFGQLDEVHLQARDGPDSSQILTAENLWYRTLKATGVPPTEPRQRTRLFLLHCHLLHVTEAIVRAVTNDSPETPHHEGFHTWIANVDGGREYLDRIHRTTESYEWRHRSDDILRTLYMNMIPKEDQKSFGKYYTPDWLARWLAAEILDDEWIERAVDAALKTKITSDASHLHGIGVLDPTCGSGTFLLAAINHILASNVAKRRGLTAADASLLVHGIDADPIAVALAKANLVRHLGTISDVNVRVYLGDALMADKLAKDKDNIHKGSPWTFRSRKPKQKGGLSGTPVTLPTAFIDHPDFHVLVHKLVDCADPKKRNHHYERCPELTVFLNPEEQETLKKAHDTLAGIIKKEDNSIWAWYAIQTAEVGRLARVKVDRILANPPWVRMNEITHAERRVSMERLAGKPNNPAGTLRIWNGGRNATGFDIAQLFLRRVPNLFLDSGWKAGFLTNAAAIKANNWQRLRETEGRRWKSITDFSEFHDKPFTGANSCAIVVDPENKKNTVHQQALTRSGKVQRGTPWENAKDNIKIQCTKSPAQSKPSTYADLPRQGATIVPHVLAVVDKITPPPPAHSIGTTSVRTLRSRQPQWAQVPSQEVTVPAHWLVPLLQSKGILPFVAARDLPRAIIPLTKDGHAVEENEETYPEDYRKLCGLYERYRSRGKSTPSTLLGRLDYHRELTSQLPLNRKRIFRISYPTSGGIMKACLVPKGALIDATAYALTISNLDEAQFLLAILNSPVLSQAFKEAQESDRDFHRTPFTKIPIPAYDSKNRRHQELVRLAATAIEETENAHTNILENSTRQPGPVKFPRLIREHLAKTGTLSRIDAIVAKLMPAYATDPIPMPPPEIGI